MAGETYSKRYGAGFSDVGGATPVDSQYLNAVETALLRLLGEDPAADEVGVWVPASNRFVFQKITNANIDPAAAISKSKLAALEIVNADIAAAANIAKSKLAALNIVNADVDAAAAIAISKLAGYPTDGTKVLKGDGTWATESVPLVYRKTSEKDVVNTVVETDLLNGEITVGAGVLGTTKTLRARLGGDFLNNTGSAQPPTITIKLGGTTLWKGTIGSGAAVQPSSSATRRAWSLNFDITNIAAANVQWMSGILSMSEAAAPTTGLGIAGNVGVALTTPISTNGTVAVDTSAAVALVVTVIHNGTSTNLSMRLKQALIEVI
jgi:hypothetical protein